MVQNHSLGRLLRRIRSYVYTGLIRQIIRETGLNEIFSKPYWRLVYLLSSDEQEHTIANRTVTFHANTFTEFMRFRKLAGERPIIEDFLTLIKSDDIFYDIGANVGTYSCFAASKLGPNQTVAFEPEPTNANRLRENLELNNLDAEVLEVALSNTDGTADLALTGEATGEGEHTIVTENAEDTIKVETAKGDSIIERRGLPTPTVAKIDVEGAELSVLRGLRDMLRTNFRLLYVEVHPEKISEYGEEASKVSTFLKDVGFEVTEIAQRGSEVFLRASK